MTLCGNFQIDSDDFVIFCGLLRKPELYWCVELESKVGSNGDIFNPIWIYLNSCTYVKFRYCEKATKFEKMSHFEKFTQSRQNKVGEFFKFFWHSQNIWPLLFTWFVFSKGGFLPEDIMVSSNLHSMVPNHHGLRSFFCMVKKLMDSDLAPKIGDVISTITMKYLVKGLGKKSGGKIQIIQELKWNQRTHKVIRLA